MREQYVSPVTLMQNIDPMLMVTWARLMRQGATHYIQMQGGVTLRVLALHPEICAASLLQEKL